jgi:hypothetical protein
MDKSGGLRDGFSGRGGSDDFYGGDDFYGSIPEGFS